MEQNGRFTTFMNTPFNFGMDVFAAGLREPRLRARKSKLPSQRIKPFRLAIPEPKPLRELISLPWRGIHSDLIECASMKPSCP